MTQESPIENIYEDEQKKLDATEMVEMTLAFKINELLDQYGYFLGIDMVNGVPKVALIKD